MWICLKSVVCVSVYLAPAVEIAISQSNNFIDYTVLLLPANILADCYKFMGVDDYDTVQFTLRYQNISYSWDGNNKVFSIPCVDENPTFLRYKTLDP